MRFMDARPDGRAIVYAHIQADPLVARAAEPARTARRRRSGCSPGRR